MVNFKLFAMLGSFGVTICDDRSSIADIQIQGTCSVPKSESMKHKYTVLVGPEFLGLVQGLVLCSLIFSAIVMTLYVCYSPGIDASLVIKAKETEVFARLRNVAVIDVDTKTIHKKVTSLSTGLPASF